MTLRHFTNLDDLFDTATSEEILSWVNELHQLKLRQVEMGKRYRTKQREFARLAKRLLDPDEVERVKALVEERLQGGADMPPG